MEGNNPPFAIGQKVIALVDGFTFNKGDIRTVLGVDKYCCHWHIDVNEISKIFYEGECMFCGKVLVIKEGEKYWPQARVFAPVQYNDATNEILEKFPIEQERYDSNTKPSVKPQTVNQ